MLAQREEFQDQSLGGQKPPLIQILQSYGRVREMPDMNALADSLKRQAILGQWWRRGRPVQPPKAPIRGLSRPRRWLHRLRALFQGQMPQGSQIPLGYGEIRYMPKVQVPVTPTPRPPFGADDTEFATSVDMPDGLTRGGHMNEKTGEIMFNDEPGRVIEPVRIQPYKSKELREGKTSWSAWRRLV